MGHAEILCLVHHGEIEGRVLAFGNRCGQLVNMPGRVMTFRDRRPDRTSSKIDQRIARCGSGSLVFRPSRATSRYASHVSNCHASTTCSHSVRRNARLNLWCAHVVCGGTQQVLHDLTRGKTWLSDVDL